jgi:hypothetical protein
LSDDFTKGSNNYPTTPQQTLLLLDKYSKKPMVVTQSEGTTFAQNNNNKINIKNNNKNNKNDDDPKNFEYDKDFYKDKEFFRCGKKGHPKAACTVKMVAADDDKSTKLSPSKGPLKEVGKTLSLINNAFKTMGKALSQVHEEIGNIADGESFGEQSHAQVGMLDQGMQKYSFATRKSSLRNHILLDNQSSVHVFCNQYIVSNIWPAKRNLQLKSNRGNLSTSNVADFD